MNEFFNLDFKISGALYESFDINEIRAINITYEYDFSTGGYFIL